MPSALRRRCCLCRSWMGWRVSLRPYFGWIGGVTDGYCDPCAWARYGIAPEPRSFWRGVAEALAVVGAFVVLGLGGAVVIGR